MSSIDFKSPVDFGHRLSSRDFFDSIEPAIRRAGAIADLIEVAIGVDDGDALDVGTVRYAAEAIRLELKDALAMLDAVQKTKPEGEKKPE